MNFEIVVISERLPDLDQEVIHIPFKEGYPHQGAVLHAYECFYSTLQKLELASQSEIISNDFIYCYDDIILNKPISSTFFDLEISLCEMSDFKTNGRWGQTIYKSQKLLNRKVFYNYETHVPMMLNKDKLAIMFSEFIYKHMKIPYAPLSLYHNMYSGRPDIVLSKSNPIVSYNKVSDKPWINYSDSGLPKLKNWIEENFKD